MKKLIATLLMSGTLLVGCGTLNSLSANDLLVQYATIKLIEQSGNVTAADVTETVASVRSLVNEDGVVTLEHLKVEVLDQIDLSGLDASERLLVMALIDQIQRQVELEYGAQLNQETIYRIGALLDLVERAAAMSYE